MCKLPSKSSKIEANLKMLLVSVMMKYRCQAGAIVDNLAPRSAGPSLR
jgi:G:T-mismatch repair DNA endonuclease (very short patch repair protein)